ncbi:hypothetical protein CC79DRAFT_1394889 [Sarocladium strictum]
MSSANQAKGDSDKPATNPEAMPQPPTTQGSPAEEAQETQQNPSPAGAEPLDALTTFQAQLAAQQSQDQVQAATQPPRRPTIAHRERGRAMAGLRLIRVQWMTRFRSDHLAVEDWAARLVLAVVNAVMGLAFRPDVASVIRQIKDTPRVVSFRNNDFQILL